jgi:hypothetical protein
MAEDGAPVSLTDNQCEYLRRISVPHYHELQCDVYEEEETLLSEILDSHAVVLITLKKTGEIS